MFAYLLDLAGAWRFGKDLAVCDISFETLGELLAD